ncbi:RICIN domain-containing protein [Micromonospora ureilytica]|uniref:RICIN domain-containing protein n=1 Tax=Micromonospora ureilytica TaxID=709868 RepID=UPI00399042C8
MLDRAPPASGVNAAFGVRGGRQSGLAMDVGQASTADGARISQWTPGTGTNQRFKLQRI